MLAPTFVITKIEHGILYFLEMSITQNGHVWSQNTAFMFSSLSDAISKAQEFDHSVDIRSTNFVGVI